MLLYTVPNDHSKKRQKNIQRSLKNSSTLQEKYAILFIACFFEYYFKFLDQKSLFSVNRGS